MAESERPRAQISWQTVIALLGASAGLTFALYLVGVLVVTRRFGTLRLPGAETIVPVDREPLLAAGARALLAPMLGAAASLLLFALLVWIGRRVGRQRDLLAIAAVLATIALVAVTLKTVRDWGTWENSGFVGAIEVAAVAGWAIHRWGVTTVRTAVFMALGVAAFASAFVLAHVWRPPVDLEYAEVELRGGGAASGIYLALTDSELFVAPAARCEDGYVTHRHVLVVPRGDVQRITLHRKAHVWDGGRRDPGHPDGGGCEHG